MAKWERYQDGCLKPHNHDTLGIALQLWDYYPKILQTILRINGMANHSTVGKNESSHCHNTERSSQFKQLPMPETDKS